MFARYQTLYEVFDAVFGLMMPCRLVHYYRRFGGSVLPKSSRQEMEATNSSNTLIAHSLTKCSQELAIGCYSASTEVCPWGQQNVSILSSRCTLAVIAQQSLLPPRIYGSFSPCGSNCLVSLSAIISRRMQAWCATLLLCSRTR